MYWQFSVIKLIAVAYCLLLNFVISLSGNSEDENGVCAKDTCPSAAGDNKGHLYRIPPKSFDFEHLHVRSESERPAVFTVSNFLTPEQCEYFIQLAEREGLQDSITRAGKVTKDIHIMDMDQDRRLSVSEMMLTIEDSYDMYLDESDILTFYDKVKLDTNHDGFITPDELDRLNPSQLDKYLQEVALAHPGKKSRFSEQVWLYPDTSTDPVFIDVQARVQKLTQLPLDLIKLSDFQVVRYGPGGHYNAHHDSSSLEESEKCCSRTRLSNCRLCRFATVLFYLNDVAEGGGTAFPLANNDTYNVDKFREEHKINLQRHCDKANLVVQPEKGKLALWYNHFIDQDTGHLGELDEFTWHGGCPVIQGEKWIANFWIKTS